MSRSPFAARRTGYTGLWVSALMLIVGVACWVR